MWLIQVIYSRIDIFYKDNICVINYISDKIYLFFAWSSFIDDDACNISDRAFKSRIFVVILLFDMLYLSHIHTRYWLIVKYILLINNK